MGYGHGHIEEEQALPGDVEVGVPVGARVGGSDVVLEVDTFFHVGTSVHMEICVKSKRNITQMKIVNALLYT